MEIIKTIISLSHSLSAFISIFLGGYILFATKGNATHKKIGLYYFYLMVINCVTSLFIYNAYGKWFFPHSLAVATLIFIIPGYLITLKKGFKYWLKIHIFCLIVSYYMLIGGAINEAFLRIEPLKIYPVGSPMNGMVQFAAMLIFTILLIYFLFKYRKNKFANNNSN